MYWHTTTVVRDMYWAGTSCWGACVIFSLKVSEAARDTYFFGRTLANGSGYSSRIVHRSHYGPRCPLEARCHRRRHHG
jgi:hypothetical protein